MDKIIVEKLNKYFSSNKLISYKKGDTIIYATDEPTGVYFIKKGYIKMSTMSVDGNEVILNIHKPGSFFPTFWAIGNKENSYSFEAMNNVTLYKTSKEDFLTFLEKNNDVLLDFIRRVLSGFDDLLINMTHLLVGNSYERVASALVVVSKRFGVKTQKGSILIELNLTHQDIANMAGITRETASVAISKLAKDKVIKRIQRKIEILDYKKLIKFTSF